MPLKVREKKNQSTDNLQSDLIRNSIHKNEFNFIVPIFFSCRKYIEINDKSWKIIVDLLRKKNDKYLWAIKLFSYKNKSQLQMKVNVHVNKIMEIVQILGIFVWLLIIDEINNYKFNMKYAYANDAAQRATQVRTLNQSIDQNDKAIAESNMMVIRHIVDIMFSTEAHQKHVVQSIVEHAQCTNLPFECV